MNILYIGPYRQKDAIGLTSLNILVNLLQSKHSVSAKPIYFNKNSITISDDNILEAENKRLDHYDLVIQNVTPDQAIKINSVSSNILIPILNEQILSKKNLETLSQFDLILTDTKVSYNKLCSYKKIANKVKTYDYQLISVDIQNNLFDIGLLNLNKKLYFIGNYQGNVENIYNICNAFIKNIYNHNFSLVLFIANLNQENKNKLDNIINQIYDNYNIKYTINKIAIIAIDYSLESMFVAHKTGDIYIDIQDEHTNSMNVKIANLFNSKVIEFNAEDNEYYCHRNDMTHGNGCLSIGYKAIESKICKAIINNTVENPVPFKKEHINLIIK
jgi:hypothetical protein